MSPLLFIGGLLGAKGRFQALAGFAGALAAFLAVIGLMTFVASRVMRAHDRAVIAADRDAGTVEAQNIMINADRTAGADKAARDRAALETHHNAMEAINAAQADDDGDPLRAGLDQLRKGRAAARPADPDRPGQAGSVRRKR